MTEREVITEESCVSCGACCISVEDQPGFVDVTSRDVDRLGKKFVRLHVHQSDNGGGGTIKTRWLPQRAGPFKGTRVCACVAFEGSLFLRTSCTVYEQRPNACRNGVRPGDVACREIRAHFLGIAQDLREGVSPGS